MICYIYSSMYKELDWGLAPSEKVIIIANTSNNSHYVWHSIKLFNVVNVNYM